MGFSVLVKACKFSQSQFNPLMGTASSLYWRQVFNNEYSNYPPMKLTEKEIRIKAPWGQMAALTWGKETSPPVLLVHGKQDVSSGFRPLVSLLPPDFFYVSLDAPGNGKSDPFPKYGRFTTADYVPAIVAVKEHFNWDKFIYIGHSLGVVIGKYFNFAYPGIITRMVELDPIPAYATWKPEKFNEWYHQYYGNYYYGDRYQKYNGSIQTAPKYTYEKAVQMMTQIRGLTEDSAHHVLERSLEPAGDGLYSFNYDQRQKEITLFPLNPEFMQELYTSVTTPTLCFLSKVAVKFDVYKDTPFVSDEKAWPHGNFKVKFIQGGHDFHINNPEYISTDISRFLLEEINVKAKL